MLKGGSELNGVFTPMPSVRWRASTRSRLGSFIQGVTMADSMCCPIPAMCWSDWQASSASATPRARRQLAARRRAKESFNDLAFALPGGTKETYFELKEGLVSERLAGLAPLWGME